MHIAETYQNLKLLDNATAVKKRKRGHQFEKLLEQVLDKESLLPRLRIRPSGEEIDGSFSYGGQFYLLEAKWYADPLPASSIYAFKGKVDGKLIGTVGVFISMSGYSEDAVDALTAGKDVNVLLFDRNDVDAFFSHSFSEVLQVKLRAAVEKGVVFYPFTSTMAVSTNVKSSTQRVPIESNSQSDKEKQILVVCEGSTDVEILTRISQRILATENLSCQIRFVAAQGKYSMPKLVNSLQPILSPNTSLIVVVDGDNEVKLTKSRFEHEMTDPIANLIVVNPELEIWAMPGHEKPRDELRSLARSAKQSPQNYFLNRIEKISLDEMRETNEAFKEYYEALVSAISVSPDDLQSQDKTTL